MDPFLSDKIRLLMKLRSAGIRETRVLSALESVPRELFVPRMFLDKAYADTALPIESGQTISQPQIVAWMTCALDITERHRVLEIGTGSGYQAAILSRLSRRVYTIERHRSLGEIAQERFKKLRLSNITARIGDGTKGWPEAAPFDRILVTAAAKEVPAALIEQLDVGGVIVMPVGDPVGEQILLRLERTADGFSSQHLMNVRFVPLIAGRAP
ncbi:MAG: protein-L-isoaspartate(D-aspartate) O-methyltransferase, partial [Rickettsiales bacterium]|nr:protein-L-isoaspartate(D-aspartate) O-methyltransferase [Rickettsiales bacterium]